MIARKSFLPRNSSRAFSRSLAALGLAGASSIVACGGHTVSLGNNNGDSADALKSIDPVTATANINNSSSSASGACPAGFAHPNICCDAATDVASTCGEWTLDPFRACNSGWTTYPNAFLCCNLADPTDCTPTPADAGASVPPPPPPIGCGFVCPPGWWSPPNGVVPVASSSSSSSGGGTTVGVSDPTNGTGSAGTSSSGSSGNGGVVTGSGSSGSTIGYGGGSCCTMLGDGTSYCSSWDNYAEPVATSCVASGSGSSSGSTGVNPGGPILFEDGGSAAEDAGSSCICACPANEPNCACDCGGEDAGSWDCVEDAGSAYPPGYDGGVTSLCGACPTGWLASSADPLLCCQTTADGVEECFSQATGSASGFSSGSSGSSNSGTSAGSSSSSSSGGTVASPPVTSNGAN
jgi:hypothetical protein